MKKIFRKVKRAVRRAGSLLERLLAPQPQSVPVRANRTYRRSSIL
jgi:hypothetical protein